ncbi:hypothetical protein Nepgr_006853 [Nepenthes gracilis]|uniref:Uncharacterized protein n=1 Tax=Nepenthes gracilis TaxID=150966 RepID=A0AAD3S5T0_NEPGR|nr:hypothetical protein Nepgr_006853 [Nepenthes gracilis]
MVNTRARLATPLEMLLTPTRTMLLMSWSTGPQAEFHRLTFNNWWSRYSPTIAYSNCFVRRKNNNNKRLHQQSFPLLPPKKVARGRRSRQRGLKKLETICLQRPPAFLARTGQWNAPGVRLQQRA